MLVWEFSKVLMHEFHYDYIKNKYDQKWKLVLKDADNLMYETKTEGVNEVLAATKKLFW